MEMNPASLSTEPQHTSVALALLGSDMTTLNVSILPSGVNHEINRMLLFSIT